MVLYIMDLYIWILIYIYIYIYVLGVAGPGFLNQGPRLYYDRIFYRSHPPGVWNGRRDASNRVSGVNRREGVRIPAIQASIFSFFGIYSL